MHYGNLVACGDQPVLVDTETLFHPTMPAVVDSVATESMTGGRFAGWTNSE